ncbi:hypothetical protein ACFWTE_21610 [Nocardiopsis sp. NPDC058631]|uniref:hypothetical protein n=1 Tax=Nocardiopsis sp. NPDC058631 TaxID=3346566 RepID=UPI00365DB9CA
MGTASTTVSSEGRREVRGVPVGGVGRGVTEVFGIAPDEGGREIIGTRRREPKEM